MHKHEKQIVSFKMPLPHTIKLGAAKKAITIARLLSGYSSNNNVTSRQIHQKEMKLKKKVVTRYELKENKLMNAVIFKTINVSEALT